MYTSLQNKNIIVIGAGSSVGEILCKKLSSEGARLHVAFRSPEKCDAFHLNNSVKYMLDLENRDEVSGFYKKIHSNLTQIDGLVFCSGTDISSPLKLTTIDQTEKAFQVNLFAVIEITRHLLFTRKVETTGSSIIFISSVAASRGFFGKTVYSAYKGALVSFARSLALEVADKRIRVNTISPGAFNSDMTDKVFETMDQKKVSELNQSHPLGFGRPEDVAAAIIFLLSEESKWITGTDMVVDGGFSIK